MPLRNDPYVLDYMDSLQKNEPSVDIARLVCVASEHSELRGCQISTIAIITKRYGNVRNDNPNR